MFDPYYKWLGIPREEQPPNHYRLLGLSLFEADPDVIDAAANRQMSYLQGCATGTQALLSQRLLNEVAMARLCLLSPGKKATYDARLMAKPPDGKRARTQTASVSEQVPAPGVQRNTSGRRFPFLEGIDEEAEPYEVLPIPSKPRRRISSAKKSRLPVVASILVLLAALVVIAKTVLDLRSGTTRNPDHEVEVETRKFVVRRGDNETLRRIEPAPPPTAEPMPLVVANGNAPPAEVTKPLDPPKSVVVTLPAPPPKVDEDLITNTLGIKLKLIPAGEFFMGAPDGEPEAQADEIPLHRVRITRPFYLGVYEVTQAEYRALMGMNPSYFSADGGSKGKVAGMDTARFPVENVSWLDAVEFCNKLSEREGLRSCYGPTGEVIESWTGYRLPTEAEWEYACRAGTTTAFAFGARLSPSEANFDGNDPGFAKIAFLNRTSPVGSYRENKFGLFDMHGNVWEWCFDNYNANYYKSTPTADPLGPSTSTSRVFRGGCWGLGGRYCRSADRDDSATTGRGSGLGFRVARVPSGQQHASTPAVRLSGSTARIWRLPTTEMPTSPVKSYSEKLFTRLFNGRNLEGWVGYADAWRVDPQRGVLISPGEGPYVYGAGTKDRFDDFVLRFGFRVLSTTKDRRSGLVLRHMGDSIFLVIGDGDSGDLIFNKSIEDPGKRLRQGKLANETGGGQFIVKRDVPDERALGDWNTCEVVCDGPSVTVTINGQIANHVPNATKSSGSIAFTQNGTKAEYRDIRVMAIRTAAPSRQKGTGRPR